MTAGNLAGNSATNYVCNALDQLIVKSGYGGFNSAGLRRGWPSLVGEYSSSGVLIEETFGWEISRWQCIAPTAAPSRSIMCMRIT
jgi:hypothetical protein